MMKKILIIGAGFLQDFVIRKAKEMGYYVLAVDADKDAVGFKHVDKFKVINIVDEDACLQFAKEEQIDGVLTVSTDYGVLSAAYIADQLGLNGISYDAAKRIKNKYLTRKCLFENGVDDSSLAYQINETTDINSLKNEIIFPVIVKPCDGSGSRGTTRVDEFNNLEEACKIAINSSISRTAEIEEFIIGEEFGVESLVVNGKVFVLGVMKKWMTEPPYYAELGHAIPSGLPLFLENKIKEYAIKAIKVLNLNHGSVNMDVLVTSEGGVHIIDIGARMGGNLIGPCIIPYGTGISYIENLIRYSVGDELDWKINNHKLVATRLLTFKGGIVRKLPDFEWIEKEFGVEIYHHLKVGDRVNEYHTNLDGCGYIVAKNDNLNDAINNAINALNYIENYIFE